MDSKENAVFLNDQGVIELRIAGLGSPEVDLEVGKKMFTLATQLQDQLRPVRLLCDFTHWLGDERTSTVLRGAIATDLGVEKVAVFGIREQLMPLIQNSAAAGGVGGRIKFFPTRAEAEAWLNA
jgi:hypothetical protein